MAKRNKEGAMNATNSTKMHGDYYIASTSSLYQSIVWSKLTPVARDVWTCMQLEANRVMCEKPKLEEPGEHFSEKDFYFVYELMKVRYPCIKSKNGFYSATIQLEKYGFIEIIRHGNYTGDGAKRSKSVYRLSSRWTSIKL